jgi:PIN domain nuclease of toxin-antitoxin system
MSAVVLDASALLALLNGEPGSDKIAAVLAESKMSVFNFAEVASHFYKLGMSDQQVEAILGPLPIEIIPADQALAWNAARLRPLTIDAGLSLGDRFCLALARHENLPAWTADKVWASVAAVVGVEIVVIR